ncbi:MAG TPA: 4-hydroxy-tetrahydrodipicolinate synthase [Rhodospirillaceae bacterium]|nr:4-hydroxy-tetrahydrodipicolinate synthase [Rhodospirillaceae bacterium]
MRPHRLQGLRGSMVALVTPFKDGDIDEVAFVRLCERQIRSGSSALVPCGTTGEAPTLTHEEQRRLIDLAVQTARGRVPVIAGAGSNCTATTIQMVRDAADLGADAALCIVPYYNRPSQEGLFQHFDAVQANGGLPILLYDVPKRTGTALELETIIRLSALNNVIGLKDASGDLARAHRLRYSVASAFLRFCGDDSLLAAHLACGSHGCISVAANVVPALCAATHEAWAAGDSNRFVPLNEMLSELSTALSLESNPIPVKWAMARIANISRELRLPMTPLPECFERQLSVAIQRILPVEEQASSDRHRIAAVA